MEEAFTAWFNRMGGHVHPHLNLFARLPNGDRGVVATEAIEEGTVLVTVPHRITIHAPRPDQSNKGLTLAGAGVWAYLSKDHPGTSPFVATVLVLLSELARGQESDLFPYLQSLPEDCSCLLNWTEAETTELKGTSIESTGESAEQVFQREVLPRMSGMPQLWPAPFNTLPHFLRAAALVQSRAFHLESNNWVTGARQEGAELYLIPGIDMINHSTQPELRNTSLHSCNVACDGPGDAVFSMKADKPIKAGDQVLHTYGDLSDAELLQTYGFIDVLPATSLDKGQQGGADETTSHNPHNLVWLPWDRVVDACRSALSRACQGDRKELRAFDASVPRKLLLLKSAKVLQPSPRSQQASPTEPLPPAIIITNADPLPDNLLTTLQVLLMDEGEVEQLRREYGQKRGKQQKRKGQEGPSASAGSSESQAPLSLGSGLMEEDEALAQVVILALVQLFDKSMLRYATSSKDDEQLVQQGPTDRRCLAALIRQGERQVLLNMKQKGFALLMKAVGGDQEEGDEQGEEEEESADDEGEEEEQA